ncbi:MAG TPA: M28 family peptidase [Thermogutta sp.]|nr:M28 family peptidase [Thermogutta sp.]
MLTTLSRTWYLPCLLGLLPLAWPGHFSTAVGDSSKSHDAAFLAALHSITADELRNHVGFLASDELEGREAGMPGGQTAGEYLAAALAQYGLQPNGSNGFFQDFGQGYRNVVAVLPGSAPELANEVIVLGAHYDHVGYGGKRNVRDYAGLVHNGADDNASGTAAILEIAQAATLLQRPPRRTLLFILFDAEEKGLLGSKHWTENPTRPLEQVKFMFNLDMVGRLRDQRVEVYGWRSSAGLRRLICQTNQGMNFDLDFSWRNRFDSDHAPFFRKSIPVLLLHTGLHDDYHRATDDFDKINYDGMEQIARWVFEMAVALADGDTAPGFRDKVNEDSDGKLREILEAPANWRDRIGIKVVSDQSTEAARQDGALRVEKVFFQTPAEAAGIQLGDRIIAVNGRRVSNPDEFAAATLLAKESSVRLRLRRNFGQGPEVEIDVPLIGLPIRLGIQWYVDEAVPQSVMVSHILPGSPADSAGIAVGDYIYSVNGQAIEDPDQFDRYIREAASPLRLEVEHRGRIRTVEIPPSGSGQQVFWNHPMPLVKLAGHSITSQEFVCLQ